MKFTRFKKTKHFRVTFPIFIILASFIFSLAHTLSIPKYLKSLQLSDASSHAKKSIFFPKIINSLTFHSIPDFNVWESGLNQVILSENLLEEGSLYFSTALQPSQNKENPDLEQNFPQQLTIFNHNLTFFLEELDKSWLAKKIIPPEIISQVSQLKTLNSELTTLTDYFLIGQHTHLIILQNSHEIRATGGFMGSYAKLELDNGQITNLTIQDIYQPDGQFTGFIESPPGVKEYLSNDQGMRLPNSNWSPDFPTSAQNILSFFAQGNEKNADGIIALNLAVIENILDITGEVYLPDYDLVVTSNNLAEVARADRDEFFPGSQQKPNFLNALLRQFVFRLQELSPDQKKQVISRLLTEIPSKNIQFYSNQEKIQEIYQKYNLSGEMTTHPTPNYSITQLPNYLFFVESNVGINKANKKITREVFINIEEKKTTITVDFSNQNSQTPLTKYVKSESPDAAPHMNYINYQRLFVLPDVKVEKITLNDSIIEKWDETLVTSSGGETFKQIGFLVTVSEKSTGKLVIELIHKEPFSLNPTLVIQKQSGIPATPYVVRYKNEEKTLLLEKDEILAY